MEARSREQGDDAANPAGPGAGWLERQALLHRRAEYRELPAAVLYSCRARVWRGPRAWGDTPCRRPDRAGCERGCLYAGRIPGALADGDRRHAAVRPALPAHER